MNKLTINTIWADNSQPDFIEVKMNIANERLNVNVSFYTSLIDMQKFWGDDLAGKILSGENLTWEGNGTETQMVKTEGSLANNKGLINLKFRTIFDEKNGIKEECTLILEVEPAQLDSFGKQIKSLHGKVGETVEL